ncbi:MAG: methyltransferase domain-containing protein [Planctomycetota bacterium]|nr:methyltransferase domain-containing protein [Planctomycetota bacterium]
MRVRRRMFAFFMQTMNPGPAATVVDVGVTSDQGQRESNFFEALYPHKDRITAVGVDDASHLERLYPGLRFVRVSPAQRLPFSDGQFDIAFSNAVVEHAGNGAAQRFFVGELVRVARRFFITTPNRWFPVETHTGVPLLHFLPPRAYRAILCRTGYGFFAEEANLNLLDARSLAALFAECPVPVTIKRIRLAGFCSNLVAYGGRGDF